MSCIKLVHRKVLCLQFLVTFVVHQLVLCSSPSCSSGLEYDCKSVQGNGTACVLGCNITITKLLSPDITVISDDEVVPVENNRYCQDDCCNFCYSNCQECFYIKILSFCLHGSANSSFTSQLLDKTSTEYKTLDQDIRASLFGVLTASNRSVFKIELLQVEWYSKSHSIIQVYVRITSTKKTMETQAINIIRNATRTGQLGALTVSRDVFDVMTEKDYDLLKDNEGEEDKLDVVELIAACIGALIILAAVCWCLFYMCTTPHQRNRCNPCHRTRRIDA